MIPAWVKIHMYILRQKHREATLCWDLALSSLQEDDSWGCIYCFVSFSFFIAIKSFSERIGTPQRKKKGKSRSNHPPPSLFQPEKKKPPNTNPIITNPIIPNLPIKILPNQN